MKSRFQSQILTVLTDVKTNIQQITAVRTSHSAVHARELKGQQNKAPGGLLLGATHQKKCVELFE